MRNHKITTLAGLISLILIGFSCKFNYSEQGKTINKAEDGDDLLLAKKSIRFIKEGKKDSLAKCLTYQLNTIHQLKQESHETIHAITHYAPDELYDFFSGVNPDSSAVR